MVYVYIIIYVCDLYTLKWHMTEDPLENSYPSGTMSTINWSGAEENFTRKSNIVCQLIK